MSRISVKIKAARSKVGIKFNMPKLFVPVDCHTPATAKDAVARQLYQAGVISKADFEKMLGVVYDGDFELDQEDFDDEAFSTRSEFEQSKFAQYDDYEDIVPAEPDGVQSDKTAVRVPDNPQQDAPSDGTVPDEQGETK